MNKMIGVVAVVVIAAGGYFGGQAMGLFGGKALSKEEVQVVLKARADEINDSGDLKYDDYSRLNKAVHMEMQLTVYAKTKMKSTDMAGGNGPEKYMESRVAQAANFLCNDETMRAALAGGARFVYQWKDSENVPFGTVHAKGATYCADSGY